MAMPACSAAASSVGKRSSVDTPWGDGGQGRWLTEDGEASLVECLLSATLAHQLEGNALVLGNQPAGNCAAGPINLRVMGAVAPGWAPPADCCHANACKGAAGSMSQ